MSSFKPISELINYYDTILYVQIYFFNGIDEKESGNYFDVGIFEEFNSNLDSCLTTNGDDTKFIVSQSELKGWFSPDNKYDLSVVYPKTRMFSPIDGSEIDSLLVEKIIYVIIPQE